MVVIKDPGSVPENWRPIVDEENGEVGTSGTLSDIIAPELRASSWSPSGRRPDISYCSRCQNSKPPRCHHCSVCEDTYFEYEMIYFSDHYFMQTR